MIYEICIAYSIRLYCICRAGKAVDNSEITNDPYLGMWISVWTVWKCMRICTPFARNEYSRMDSASREKCRSVGQLRRFAEKRVYAYPATRFSACGPIAPCFFGTKVLYISVCKAIRFEGV